MGQRVVDTWAKGKVGQPFVWGTNDCHWLLYEFMKINGWEDPNNMIKHRGKYTDRHGANELVKTLNIEKEVTDAGYTQVNTNRLQAGDIIRIEMRNSAYDLYMPIIYGRTALCGDPMSKTIIQKNMDEAKRTYLVYRRKV